MMVRAIICCAALVLGLLATLGATAQSAAKGRPLDLMAFMRADAKAGAKTAAKTTAGKTSKHRPGASRSAARADQAPGIATNSATNLATELATDPATPAQPAPLPAAAAYAAHGGDDVRNDVQVVTSDQLNAIDLAMLRSAPETVGAAQKTDTDVSAHITPADAGQARDQARDQVRDQVRDLAFNPDKGATSPVKPAGRGDAVPRDDARDDARNDARDDSWMGRIWSAVGDGFVALMAMLRQLFG